MKPAPASCRRTVQVLYNWAYGVMMRCLRRVPESQQQQQQQQEYMFKVEGDRSPHERHAWLVGSLSGSVMSGMRGWQVSARALVRADRVRARLCWAAGSAWPLLNREGRGCCPPSLRLLPGERAASRVVGGGSGSSGYRWGAARNESLWHVIGC